MAIKRFLANEWDRANSQKRGGGVAPLSLDWQDAETRYQITPVDNLSPDKLYDRAWAVIVLERVIIRLRDEHTTEGKASLYEKLKPFLMMGKSEIPYARAAGELKMSEGAVRVAVHRLRRRYRELLRDEIAQTLANPAQAGEEMQALFSALADN
jgi:RNA polymerase sigma-70 factor (ECF subfamily)